MLTRGSLLGRGGCIKPITQLLDCYSLHCSHAATDKITSAEKMLLCNLLCTLSCSLTCLCNNTVKVTTQGWCFTGKWWCCRKTWNTLNTCPVNHKFKGKLPQHENTCFTPLMLCYLVIYIVLALAVQLCRYFCLFSNVIGLNWLNLSLGAQSTNTVWEQWSCHSK